MKKFFKFLELCIKKYIDNLLNNSKNTVKLVNYSEYLSFPNTGKRFLLLRQDRIGDLIISTSFVRLLKQNFHSVDIDILLSKNNVSASICVKKYINKIWILDKNIFKYVVLLYRLRKNRYDLIIDLFDNPSTTSAVIIKFVNPLLSLGIDKSNSKIYDYTVPMLDRYNSNIVERVCNLLIAFGIDPNNCNLKLEFPLQSNKKNVDNGTKKIKIGINVSGGSDNRYWGIENCDGLIIKIMEYYSIQMCEVENYNKIFIQLFYTKKYISDIKILKQKHPFIIDEYYNSFEKFAEGVSECSLIISPDTSIVHLCSAFSIPIVVLYLWTRSKTSHKPWYPYSCDYISLETTEETIKSISYEEVYIAFKELIEKSK